MSLSHSQPPELAGHSAVPAAAGSSNPFFHQHRPVCRAGDRVAGVDRVGNLTLAIDHDVLVWANAAEAERPIEAIAASANICFLVCLIMISSSMGRRMSRATVF